MLLFEKKIKELCCSDSSANTSRREIARREEDFVLFSSLFSSRLRRDLFPTIGNQVFSYDRCNMFPGLSYIKSNNTFLNSVRKSDVEAHVEFSFNVTERAGVTCY